MEPSAIDFEPPTGAAEWDRLLGAAPCCLWQQGWAYGAALAHRGLHVERHVIRRAGAPAGLVQLVGRHAFAGRLGVIAAPGGPVWLADTSPATAARAVAALRRRCGRTTRPLLLTPGPAAAGLERAPAAAGLRRVATGTTTAFLPVEIDAAAQAARLARSWRGVIRRGPPPALAIEVLLPGADPAALAAVLAVHERERRHRGFGAVPSAVVAHAAKHGRAVLLLARHEGDLAGAVLLLLHGRTATYQLGWSDAAGRRLEAHRHLLWRGLGELRRRGVRVLDLGGLNVPDGIAAFKCGTGAAPHTLVGTYV